MTLTELYQMLPAEQRKRIHCEGTDVFLRTPKGYFAPRTLEKIIHLKMGGDGNLWRVSNSDIPDSVAAQLNEWGIG